MGLFDFIKKALGKEEAGTPTPPTPQPPRPGPWEARYDPQTGAPLQPPAPPLAVPVVPTAKPQAAKPQPAKPQPPQDVTLDLDAAQFTPLSEDDVRRQAGSINLRTAFTFGLRNQIPPTSDPRTIFIDRAMVGHGLITPEELAEIHQVGEQMRELRPALQTAAQVAEHAVQFSKEERAKRKAEKQAAAAERKKKHAEAVAKRKATDIVFLGRGVSNGLADRRSMVEKLESASLPILATPADAAAALKLTIPRLRWLAFHSDAAMVSHYIRFTVPKRSGGVRQLSAPHKDLAAAQEWILENVLRKVPTHAMAHGFVPGRSTVTNAAPHLSSTVVVNTDLTDFFPTITFPRVRGVFRQLGYSPAVATIFALLCTESPRRSVVYAGKPFHVATGPRALPQGACTSPALSNLAARRLDSRLAGIAVKLGWRYTRYADDMTFSTTDAEGEKKVGYVMARIRHIAGHEGFSVNEAKTRVQRPSAAQTVTGVVVNEKLHVPRETVRRLRAILHRAKTEGLAKQNREKLPHFEAWVRGTIAYIHMVSPQQAAPLSEALAAVSG